MVSLARDHVGDDGALTNGHRDGHFFTDAVNPTVRAIERIIGEIAPTNIPVIVVGESGTGKEVVAQRIHRLSARAEDPFLKIGCRTLSADALDVPTQGRRGASFRNGLTFAGSILMEEIADLGENSQMKLLGILPEETGSEDGEQRARIISSSSRNLEEEVRAGRFHEELYYRLNGICLRLPPLRHRKQDIPGFIDFFLTKYSAQFRHPKPKLSSKTLSEWIEYTWPGNIRQLESAVKNIVILGDERLALGDVESSRAARPYDEPDPSFSLKETARAASRQAEKELILRTLDRTHWNRKRAAKQLQISYKALLYKLKQIGIGESSGA